MRAGSGCDWRKLSVDIRGRSAAGGWIGGLLHVELWIVKHD